MSIDSIVLNDTRSIGCQPRCSLNIDQGLIEKQLREWIDTQLQITLVHIIQNFKTYRSVHLSADTYRGGIGKEVWEMYIMALPPDCCTRLHFEPKHCTTSLLSHSLLHISILGSISEWATDLFFRLIFHKSSSCNRVALLYVCTVTSNLLLQYTNKITFKYIINFFSSDHDFDFANSNKKFWIGLAIFFCRLTYFSL